MTTAQTSEFGRKRLLAVLDKARTVKTLDTLYDNFGDAYRADALIKAQYQKLRAKLGKGK